MKVCSIDGCEHRAIARGLCDRCRQRAAKGGRSVFSRPELPPSEADELWLPVVGFAGYQVSSKGRVWSNGRRQLLRPGRVQGYLQVSLSIAGVPNQEKVHRLVLDAFVGPRPEMQGNHKDGNKANARLENLEWVTPSGNILHAIRTGLRRRNTRRPVPTE